MVDSRGTPSRNVVVPAMLALVAVLFTPTAANAGPTTTTRVSVASDGAQGNGGSFTPSLRSISGNGRYVAFVGHVSNLVAGDTNGVGDVFVRDSATGTTTRVSVSSSGSEADGPAGDVAISADGNHVAYASAARNLVGGDTNGSDDIFVHDRTTRTTTRVSVASDGTQGNRRSHQPSISADGRYVAFTSEATTLVAGDTNHIVNARGTTVGADVFVHDRQTATTTRVSVSSAGIQGAGESTRPAISGDGRYVAFQSAAPNLVAGRSGGDDIFVHDRTTATTTQASTASDGTQGNGVARTPDISADGSLVSFASNASNLVPGDTNSAEDIFVHDRRTGATTRASVASDGTQTTTSTSGASISGDGRHVAFATTSPLVSDDTNGKSDLYVRDTQTATTIRTSVAHDGTQANDSSFRGSISHDGSHVAFDSLASNLVPDDTNANFDVFVRGPSTELPTVSMGDAAVHEGDAGTRAAVFTVSLAQPAPDTVTVAYATVKGTALGTDFTAKSGTLSFAAGTTSATVKVPVSGDTSDEGDESFTLALSSPTGATVSDATGVGTILDDDPGTGRRLAIGDVSVHEGDSGGRAAVFNVSLSKASTGYVTVNFATAKGTAIGTDFTAKSGTLSFAPGTTSKNVKVAIAPDVIAEGTETFTVTLSNSSGPTIFDALGVGTIIDDD